MKLMSGLAYFGSRERPGCPAVVDRSVGAGILIDWLVRVRIPQTIPSIGDGWA